MKSLQLLYLEAQERRIERELWLLNIVLDGVRLAILDERQRLVPCLRFVTNSGLEGPESVPAPEARLPLERR